MAKIVIFVDSQHGSDSYDGEILTPLKTLSAAYSVSSPGATIILQDGTLSSYGSLNISKNLNIKAANGASPIVGSLVVTDAQCSFDGLIFDGLTTGISVTNSKNIGGVSVGNCTFNNVDNGININGINYITIHRNTFRYHKEGIIINNAQEVNVSSNIFDTGYRSIEVLSCYRLDIWRNTIFGAFNPTGAIVPDENLRIIYVTLNALNIVNKQVQLPSFAVTNTYGYDVAINTVNGPSFDYGTDYIVSGGGSLVSWNSLGLEGLFRVGDILRIMYSEEADPGGGEAIRAMGIVDANSRIDSNNITKNITDIDLGIFFNTPLKLRYNNHYGVTGTYWYSTIVPPTEVFQNFSDDPIYVNGPGGNFHLTGGSPDIDRGDPNRWDTILSEMGLIDIPGVGLTGGGTITRKGITPFDRDIDRDGAHRYYEDATGDVGAYEYLRGEHTGNDYYVEENGQDIVHVGTQFEPLGTLEKAFSLGGVNDTIYAKTNDIAGLSGNQYGRYISQQLPLGASRIISTRGSVNDAIYVYPTFSSFSTGESYVSYGSHTGGDGTKSNPYREISQALDNPASYIVVEPGFYAPFTGVVGKTLIGVPKTSVIDLKGKSYQKLEYGFWTGIVGVTTFNINNLVLTGSAVARSLFLMSARIEYKCRVDINSATFEMKLDNADNSISIKKESSQLKIKYTTSGSSYTVPFLCSYTVINISIIINSGSVKILIKGNTANTGTITTSGTTTVTGSSTLFQTDRIALGARIGFGTTDPTLVTTWYEIATIVSDTELTTTVAPPAYASPTVYVIEELRIERNITLSSNYTNNWAVIYETTGVTSTTISDFSVMAESISSVSYEEQTSVKHKVFAIYGGGN